jgi:hypothetical protein
MVAITVERTAQLVMDLRRGLDIDGVENPAGGLFTDAYTEHEISMTGGATVNLNTGPSQQDFNCPPAFCCAI